MTIDIHTEHIVECHTCDRSRAFPDRESAVHYAADHRQTYHPDDLKQSTRRVPSTLPVQPTDTRWVDFPAIRCCADPDWAAHSHPQPSAIVGGTVFSCQNCGMTFALTRRGSVA